MLLYFAKTSNFLVSNVAGSNAKFNTESGVKNVIFQSIDNGKTWQDISKGLPDNMENYDFFSFEKDLFIHAGNEIFQRKSDFSTPIWTKAYSMKDLGDVAVCKTGLYAIRYDGIISKKHFSDNSWASPYPTFYEKNLRTVYETNSGAVLIGTDNGLFKSTNEGKTWKKVLEKGWVIKIVESKGVLVATSQNGIIRSTDDGENWNVVISEGGVGIDVAIIKDGFAAISYNTITKTRRVRTSHDTGKTWQTIDEDLPPHDLIANILQVDNYLYCGHPKGIFRSPNKGRNWDLILPAIGNKVFSVYSMGNIIYAIPKAGGC
ncbi:exo-alpha-sialidase [Lacihabitans sp. LS3-19]|nr:exo-alpha-sialidase [Lacihabitans sp. LS3-19]